MTGEIIKIDTGVNGNILVNLQVKDDLGNVFTQTQLTLSSIAGTSDINTAIKSYLNDLNAGTATQAQLKPIIGQKYDNTGAIGTNLGTVIKT